jgi:uncharacterized membrane protein YpjA
VTTYKVPINLGQMMISSIWLDYVTNMDNFCFVNYYFSFVLQNVKKIGMCTITTPIITLALILSLGNNR